LSVLLDHETAAEGAYNASRTLFGDRYVRSLMTHNYRKAASNGAPMEMDTDKLSVQQQVSFYEITGYMRNTLLRDSDVFSMVHGLELRVPFVDREVARAAFDPANSLKAARSGPKPLLVDAVRDLLPASVVERPKQGFTLPFEKWMRNEMFSEVESRLSATSPERTGLDHSSVKRVWREFQARRPGMNWSRPWALYTLIRWARLNDVTLHDADMQSPHHSDIPAVATPA
jgi:asparagine synthase (glutamine-hydrolysing)